MVKLTLNPSESAESSSCGKRDVRLMLPLCIVAAATLQQVLFGLDCDVSWLITLSERLLDGWVPYVDFIEVNPPASILLYVPSVAFARFTGFSPEFIVSSFVLLLGALSVWMTMHLLLGDRGLTEGERLFLVASTLLVTLVLPAKVFAQREHIAVLTLLPLTAVATNRAEGRRVAVLLALVAGLGGGITVCVKPHFALAIVPILGLVIWRTGSLRCALRVEWVAASFVVLSYAASVLRSYPEYIAETVPLVIAVYVPLRENLWVLVTDAPFMLFVAALGTVVLIAGRKLARSSAIIPAIAACGFAAALLIQGKGYPNHLYPALALMLIAVSQTIIAPIGGAIGGGWSALSRGTATKQRQIEVLVLAALGLATWVNLGAVFDYPGLAEAVARVAPPRPKVIAASANIAVGHPLTRWLQGEWVGRPGALWVSGAVGRLLDESDLDPTKRKILHDYAAHDKAMFTQDLARSQPDVILFEGSTTEDWAKADQDLAAVLMSYRPVEKVGDVTIWVLQNPTSPK